MKDAKKAHKGHESNTDFGKKTYQSFFEPIPYPATFSDKNHQVSKSGAKLPERHWGNVNPIDDATGQPEQHLTPIPGRKDPISRKHSATVHYSKGKELSEATGPNPNLGMDWAASAPTGSPTMYENQGPQTPTFKHGDKPVGWKNRDEYSTDTVASALAPAKRRVKK